MTGTNGALIEVLSACLIVNKVFTTTDDTTFTNNTAEARLVGGAAFALFPTPGTGDRTYFGLAQPYESVSFTLATAGAGGSYVWEYWNGTAWTALTVTDGTNGFTQSGTVSWAIPANWATNAVNGVTLYWTRVRPSSTPTTNPMVNHLTIVGWKERFTDGAYVRVYQMGGPIGFYLRVRDDGPNATSLQREAWMRGWEVKADVNDTADANNTGPFPTHAQRANGLVVRKSGSVDTTARPWALLADDRTFYLFIGSEGSTFTTQPMYGIAFGEFFSLAGTGDGYRVCIIGRNTENAADTMAEGLSRVWVQTAGAVSDGYIARSYSGTGGAVDALRTLGLQGTSSAANNASILGGWSTSVVPNPVDGAYHLLPIWIAEGTTGSPIRGRLRGILGWGLNVLSALNGDTLSGSGASAGRSWVMARTVQVSGGTQTFGGLVALEVSDTWETNL